MAGFGDGHSRNAHSTARGANPDNLDIKPAAIPARAGTNWFPLKTLDLPNSVLMLHILLILHTGENSNSSAEREFCAVERLATVKNGCPECRPRRVFRETIVARI